LPYDYKKIPANLAISVQDLSIEYKVNVENKVTLKNLLIRSTKGERTKTKDVKALQKISFDINHGSVVGIIGANGAGKSSLMRSIAGILPPSDGRVIVNGKVSTLLALGVGFNQALSGRDNIILGGLAAGLSRSEIEEKMEEIINFAALPEGFIDLPVRTYSSGMYSRVAFSVSTALNPDILLLDEALSTGDAVFKEKSFNKMRELCKSARTIVIVSHGLSTIEALCNEVIWLEKGKIIKKGSPEIVVKEYLEYLKIGKLPTSLEDF